MFERNCLYVKQQTQHLLSCRHGLAQKNSPLQSTARGRSSDATRRVYFPYELNSNFWMISSTFSSVCILSNLGHRVQPLLRLLEVFLNSINYFLRPLHQQKVIDSLIHYVACPSSLFAPSSEVLGSPTARLPEATCKYEGLELLVSAY